MALTNNTLPAILPTHALPKDELATFADAQTLSSTGYINNANAVIDLGNGYIEGTLVLDLSALDMTTGDETYQLALIGSNDASFGNGNCDLLAFQDFSGAATSRVLATILAATPAVPLTGQGATRYMVKFCNQKGGFLFRYAKLYATLSGTTPSITLNAWLVNRCS